MVNCAQPSNAVSLISEPYLDIKIEFAPPLDYKEALEGSVQGTQEKPEPPIGGDSGKTLRVSGEVNATLHSVCSNWY